jgi:hypothetical protein
VEKKDLGFSELESWVNMTGKIISPWQSEMIIKMSRVYNSAIHEYNCKDVPCPVAQEVDKAAVTRDIKSAFSKLRKNNG